MVRLYLSVLVLHITQISSYNGDRRPNILFIIADDLRPTLGAYGYPGVVSPFLDDLARKSVIFTRTYAQQALCGPSRTSFLTSRRPDTTRLYDVHSYWRKSSGNFTTLPQHFKDNGYFTASFGKVFHPGIVSGHTYDFQYSWSVPAYIPSTRQYKMKKVCPGSDGSLHMNVMCPVNVSTQPEKTLPDIQTTQAAVKFLKQWSTNQNEPFFLAVGYYKPHIPFKFPQEFLNIYPVSSINPAPDPVKPRHMPDVAWNPWSDIRLRDDVQALNISWPYGPLPRDFQLVMRQGYYSSTTYMDDLVGRLLAALDQCGFSNNTIIVFCGDHGWSLGEHQEWSKYSNFEVATRVPLMFAVPGVTFLPSEKQTYKQQSAVKGKHSKLLSGSMKSDVLSELVDIFPTLTDLTGIKTPPLCPEHSHKVDLCTEGQSLASVIIRAASLSHKLSRDMIFTKNKNSTEKLGRKSAAFSQYPRPSVLPQNNSDQCRLEDVKIMGYTMRTDKYRYTEWVNFDPSTFKVNWTLVYGRELYLHDLDQGEDNNVAYGRKYKDLVSDLSKKLRQGWRGAL